MARPPLHALGLIAALAAGLVAGLGCDDSREMPRKPTAPSEASRAPAPETPRARPERDYRLVHVFVALCDNRNQGIVPVPAHLGDGRDAAGNLYWGAAYGVRTFLARSPRWEEVPMAGGPRRPEILARALFRSRGGGPAVMVLAEAYDGARMDLALADFLSAASGRLSARVGPRDGGAAAVQAGAMADLVCFVGHNGLMDLRLERLPEAAAGARPEAAVVLACKSRPYFAGPLRAAGCPILLATNGFMAPEAYTLDAAIEGWAAGETPEKIRARAADAYARYQKCGRSAAMKLFAGGE